MPHAVNLISTFAAAFGVALVLGYLAERIKLPALVGYLLAGVLIGPHTPGFVADMELAGQLAEVGVMLLMFGVGLHFSVDDLLSVKRVALPGAIVQMGVATGLGIGLATWWGWPFGEALVFGLTLSVASTVVLLKALEARGQVESVNGRIAVGWLVVEDLAMVLVLVLLPPLAGLLGAPADKLPAAGGAGLWETLARTMVAVAAFVGLMLVVGRRLLPWLLWRVAATGSRELFTLGVVAAALTVAYGSAKLFGVSFALGAFFAGMVLRESEYSHRAAEQTLPLRDAFAVLFFVSVGMLFDPMIMVEAPVKVLAVVAIIVVGKSIAASALVLLLRYPLNTALTVSAGLAQIGEFSFILAGLGMSLGLLSPQGQSLVLAGALISIALNPLIFAAIAPILVWARERSPLAQRLASREDPLSELPADTDRRLLAKQVVLVGYGRVGREIAAALRAAQVPFIVAEENREVVERLRTEGTPAVCGNATDPATLIQAHIAEARMLAIAVPEANQVGSMIRTARQLNPGIAIVVRSHHHDEAALIEAEHGGKVFVGETELAKSMAAHVLAEVHVKAA